MTVLNSVTSLKLKDNEKAQLCWMDSGLRDRSFDSIVKWEFTTLGYYSALFDHFVWPAFWLLAVHVVMLNFYYRGLVYIIVGKRKKPQPNPDVDDDDDWNEIDDDIDKLTKGSA